MSRAVLAVLDSVGVGGAPDADAFGDTGSNTIGHIAESCAAGNANDERRTGPLRLPNLVRNGLGAAAALATGSPPPGLEAPAAAGAAWGIAEEISRGKDTPSGHWELSGVPVHFDWGYFPRTVPAFPKMLTKALIQQADLPGVLGDCHASGTEIIAELGEEHMRTGKPILYTSADSVVQIAAHEETFGLERLYAVCGVARRLVEDLTIGRVIARPFVGQNARTFERTANRKDLAVLPHAPTVLDRHADAGGTVVSIGKIGDIFAHSGTGKEVKAAGNEALFDTLLSELEIAGPNTLLVVNFVDFDTLYGHRRDVAGYAAALEAFDRRLPELEAVLGDDDLAILTADHGCDPSWPGSDHTRECVPVLALGGARPKTAIGRRTTFADVGESLAAHLGLPPMGSGTSFLSAPA